MKLWSPFLLGTNFSPYVIAARSVTFDTSLRFSHDASPSHDMSHSLVLKADKWFVRNALRQALFLFVSRWET